jgi:nucleotide-binding universal stress UspA family protein
MTYATVMVHVDVDGELGSRVSIAADLAARLKAHLIGIGAWAPMSVFLADEAKVDPAPTEPHLQDMKSLLDLKGREFCAAVGKSDSRAEWRSILDFPTDAVAREARAADLIVVGRAGENPDPFRALDPASLVLKVARPVLVVPKPVEALRLRRAAIAWKDVREARRAVRDALPLLQLVESVMIVAVSEAGEGERVARQVEDVAGYLTRHGIKTVAERVRPPDASVTDALLRLVHDENIDLLVAGAYGHSRLGEWAFGGVTRGLLTQSPVCCLLSH